MCGPPRRPPGSQLADRIAALEAEKAALLVQQPQHKAARAAAAAKPSTTTTNTTSSSTSDAHATTTTTPNADVEAATAQLRLDLAEALRAKGQAEARLRTSETELRDLRARTKTDARKLHDLTAERNALAAKLKDRNEELLGKNKLLKVRGACHLLPATHTRSGGGAPVSGGALGGGVFLEEVNFSLGSEGGKWLTKRTRLTGRSRRESHAQHPARYHRTKGRQGGRR